LDKENAILKQKNEFLSLDIEELSKKHEDCKKREKNLMEMLQEDENNKAKKARSKTTLNVSVPHYFYPKKLKSRT
jgi:chaperonin cofactor prefoldin